MELTQEWIAIINGATNAPYVIEVPIFVGGLLLHLGGGAATNLKYIIRIAIITYQFFVEVVAGMV